MEPFRKLSMEELGRVSPEMAGDLDRFPLVLVLDSIRSLSNVGSVFRTADAFKLQELHLCGFTGQPPHREIQKTALGATETVPWQYFQHIEDAIQSLKTKGFTVFALEQATPKQSLETFCPEPRKKIAIVLGNEISGVSDDALALCDGVLEIPQFGSKHSLNVAVSAGIAVWQVVSGWVK